MGCRALKLYLWESGEKSNRRITAVLDAGNSDARRDNISDRKLGFNK
jgi:hypothetical protein